MTRTIFFIMLLYASPALAQRPLILENLTIDNQDRNFFAKEIISATSASKPVAIVGDSRVEFQAVNRIYMGPGFSTADLSGDAYFHAYIETDPNTIEELYARSANLSIAPNPNNGNFTISIRDEHIRQFIVTDMLGRDVYQQQNLFSEQEELHLESLPKGIYFVKAMTDKEMYVSKVEMK